MIEEGGLMNDELAAMYAADRREHNPQTAPSITYEESRSRDGLSSPLMLNLIEESRDFEPSDKE